MFQWPGSSVGTATRYGLDGPGIECRWGRDFPHLSRPALGPTQPPVKWVPCLSRGQRAAGAWRWSLTPFYCRGQERVELYLYSPYGPYGLYRASVPVQRCTLRLLYSGLEKLFILYGEVITFLILYKWQKNRETIWTAVQPIKFKIWG